MLVLDQLGYAHPGQVRSYRFSMEAEPGMVTAVSGPSGSGKSTLLDLVAGFLKPAEGRLTIDGTDIVPRAPEERPISLLLQSDSLFEHLSAARNVALGLPTGTEGSSGRIETALAQVGLGGIGRQRASTLSGGQKQRVALARTLLRDRKVLLLDEPFSALDDETRGAVRDLVKYLTERQGWITVLVSHHRDDIAALAGRRYEIVEHQLVLA